MSTLLIRDHMSSYAAAVNQLVGALETSRRAVAPADRRMIQKALNAMMDLNVLLLFHFSRRRISADQIADMRAKIADLADLSAGQECRPPAKLEGYPVRTMGRVQADAWPDLDACSRNSEQH